MRTDHVYGHLTLVACDLPGWEHLHHRHRQTLRIRALTSLRAGLKRSLAHHRALVRSANLLPGVCCLPGLGTPFCPGFSPPAPPHLATLTHPSIGNLPLGLSYSLPQGWLRIAALPRGILESDEVSLVRHSPRRLVASYLLSPSLPFLNACQPSSQPPVSQPQPSRSHSHLEVPRCLAPTPLIFPCPPLLPPAP